MDIARKYVTFLKANLPHSGTSLADCHGHKSFGRERNVKFFTREKVLCLALLFLYMQVFHCVSGYSDLDGC